MSVFGSHLFLSLPCRDSHHRPIFQLSLESFPPTELSLAQEVTVKDKRSSQNHSYHVDAHLTSLNNKVLIPDYCKRPLFLTLSSGNFGSTFLTQSLVLTQLPPRARGKIAAWLPVGKWQKQNLNPGPLTSSSGPFLPKCATGKHCHYTADSHHCDGTLGSCQLLCDIDSSEKRCSHQRTFCSAKNLECFVVSPREMTRVEERISDRGITCTKQPGTVVIFPVVLTAEDGNSRD